MIDLLIDWYGAMGVDEAIGDAPLDRLAAKPAPIPEVSPAPVAASTVPAGAATNARSLVVPAPRAPSAATSALGEQLLMARQAAAAATDLDALRQAVADFEGCSLKATATNTVFADGNPAAPLMLIGEAPGAEEDRIGRPFVGVSGKLLDRMLAAIEVDRSNAYITNVLFWRPPGNRAPTETEIALCRPFVERHIALVKPRILVLVGGTACAAMKPGSEGITRLRGRWFDLQVNGMDQPVATIAMYHPSFLLRFPERKRESWADLLKLKARLEDISE
jgi:uracil-DNA glycosylase